MGLGAATILLALMLISRSLRAAGLMSVIAIGCLETLVCKAFSSSLSGGRLSTFRDLIVVCFGVSAESSESEA